MSDSIRRHQRRLSILLLGSILLLLVVGVFTIEGARSPVAIILLLATIFASLMALLRFRSFTSELVRTIQKVTLASTEMSRGNLERAIPTPEISVQELRELSESINMMATRARADITEMKRLERVRSEFLGNVSHELRTPIFSVQGYIETLIDGAVDDPSVRDDFLNKAHQNVLRLHSLLTDLIEISRIESGEMKMSFRYFDAAEHFRSIVEELRPTAEMAGIGLHFEVIGGSGGDTSVLGDRERLKQVIVNLVENAIKYNRPDGRVDVELELVDSEAIVSVRDTGIGIPEDDIPRIFERFYRVNKDRSRAVGGSGLGLAIVKHILEAHGTQIRVESRPGVGSTFSFRLKR
jgi:two-component system phosphate regulon sensor histidine kinase PhoR